MKCQMEELNDNDIVFKCMLLSMKAAHMLTPFSTYSVNY